MGALGNFNYLFFIILTLFQLFYIFGKTAVVKNPLNCDQFIRLDGTEAFWILTFSTGLLAMNVSGIIDLMAIRLLVIEILCLIAIFSSPRKPMWSRALWMYAIYIAWILIGCIYSPSSGFGFRVVLKYLYPLIITIVASMAVRGQEVFLKACLGALLVGFIDLALNLLPSVKTLIPGFWWYGTAEAIHYISLMVLCLSFSFFVTEKLKYRVLAFLFIIPCFVWVFRTSIFGSFVALSAFFFIKYRFKSLPIIFSLFILGVALVFTIPSLHDKMFKEEKSKFSLKDFQEGKVSQEDIRTNSRDVMWEYLLKKFYAEHSLMGCGTGTVQHHMYSSHLFGGLKVPHNDYVQLLCDNGLVGLVLYVSIALFVFLHCFRVYHKYSDIPIRICALTAGASVLGVAITSYSDNTVNYSMATLSMPYGFYGMMLGLLGGKSKEE